MSRVPLCTHLPWTQFAPPPPSPPPLPPPPSPRPYPFDTTPLQVKEEPKEEETAEDVDSADVPMEDLEESITTYMCPKIEAEMVSVPKLEPSERLKAPILSAEDEVLVLKEPSECKVTVDVESDFVSEPQEHRTVERTKARCDIDGRTLYALCETTRTAVPFDYAQTSATPVVTLPLDETEAVTALDESLAAVEESTERDEFGRPLRPTNFTEWHECAQLGDLIALPYVVID